MLLILLQTTHRVGTDTLLVSGFDGDLDGGVHASHEALMSNHKD